MLPVVRHGDNTCLHLWAVYVKGLFRHVHLDVDAAVQTNQSNHAAHWRNHPPAVNTFHLHMAASMQMRLERQDLSCTYLAHHQLESVAVVIINIIVVIIIIIVNFIVNLIVVITIISCCRCKDGNPHQLHDHSAM